MSVLLRTLLAALAGAVAALALAAPAHAAADPKVSVLTRSLYLGADITPLFAASPGSELEHAAGQVLAHVDASKPKSRMKLAAQDIVISRADFASLQEVTRWLTGPKGSPEPAETVRFDYLASILKELRKLGADYEVVALIQDFDLEMPTDRGVDVRVQTGNVILAREGIQINNARSEDFANQHAAQTQALGAVETTRGWNIVDFTIRGERAKLLNPHLEPLAADVRLTQAHELVKGPLSTSLPVILAGNVNAGPDLPQEADRKPYWELRSAGLRDRRTTAFNCCFNDDLTTGTWDRIVDRIMVRPKMKLLRSFVRGTEQTPEGLYASTHGSVTSRLRLPRD